MKKFMMTFALSVPLVTPLMANDDDGANHLARVPGPIKQLIARHVAGLDERSLGAFACTSLANRDAVRALRGTRSYQIIQATRPVLTAMASASHRFTSQVLKEIHEGKAKELAVLAQGKLDELRAFCHQSIQPSAQTTPDQARNHIEAYLKSVIEKFGCMNAGWDNAVPVRYLVLHSLLESGAQFSAQTRVNILTNLAALAGMLAGMVQDEEHHAASAAHDDWEFGEDYGNYADDDYSWDCGADDCIDEGEDISWLNTDSSSGVAQSSPAPAVAPQRDSVEKAIYPLTKSEYHTKGYFLGLIRDMNGEGLMPFRL